MNHKTLFVLSASLLAQLTCAHSAVISYNWDFYGTIPTNSTSVAGVVPVANWNNSYDGTWESTNPPTVSSPELNLIDDSGNATTTDIYFSGTGSYFMIGATPTQDGDGTYNKRLLNGYVDMLGGNPVTVNLAEIPYAQYDIYIYLSSDTAGREGYVTNTNTASTFFFSTYGSGAISGSNTVFVQATETSDLGPNAAATYARFSNLSGASQSLSVFAAGNGGIAGIQVVQVPEPSAAILGGLGMLALLRRRR